ncbi:hypothetical protein [Hyalangium rubrum]|uniref:Uncharacterized protein n=1 Tax=Hyalangium rubrum TaxID=3103134 RepID=A0ABU5H1Z5_9BACT|nr:hypothetical protein [Hyalangium sp. s54d21]MDY7227415.1 hypothetical protein [Hyalangium sp. s54d21]
MAQQQDQDREKVPQKVDSDNASGQGRERRDDTDVYPQKRGSGDFGTHGGPNKYEKKLDAPSRIPEDE